MSEQQFPYVGQLALDGNNFFILNENDVYDFNKKEFTKFNGDLARFYLRYLFKDITAEYLQFSKIRVESEEHGRFILEIAERCGYNVNYDFVNKKYLCFYSNLSCASLAGGDCNETFIKKTHKEIFLPLPPVEQKVNQPPLTLTESKKFKEMFVKRKLKMNEQQFPYVGQHLESKVVLFILNETDYYSFDRKVFSRAWRDGELLGYKDITREYLANSKIKVESEEHAAFILKLAERYGFTQYNVNTECVNFKYFYFFEKCECAFSNCDEFFKNNIHKEIFLPLPPSEETVRMTCAEEKPSEEIDLDKVRDIVNNSPNLLPEYCELPMPYGDNTYLYEWPRVGEELYCRVSTVVGLHWEYGTLISKGKDSKGQEHFVFESNGSVQHCQKDRIRKTEEQKREEAINKLAEELHFKSGNNKDDLISPDKFVIAAEIYDGNVEGVKYEEKE